MPATLFVFDLLAFDGFDLRGLPLVERKRLLAKLLVAPGVLRYTDHVEERGVDLYHAVRRVSGHSLRNHSARTGASSGRSARERMRMFSVMGRV